MNTAVFLRSPEVPGFCPSNGSVGTVRGAAVFSLEPFTVRFENFSSCLLSVTHREEPDRPLLVAGDEKGTFLQAARTAPREPPITSDGGYNCGFPPLPPSAGRWVHMWSGVAVNGTGTSLRSTTVAAPLGRPPVFYKEHSEMGRSIASQIRHAVGR